MSTLIKGIMFGFAAAATLLASGCGSNNDVAHNPGIADPGTIVLVPEDPVASPEPIVEEPSPTPDPSPSASPAPTKPGRYCLDKKNKASCVIVHPDGSVKSEE